MTTLPSLVAAMMISILVGGGSAGVERTVEPADEQMPAALETEYALSALPPDLRQNAAVYLLDPKTGYRLARRGTSGISCLVERTAWEEAVFHDDMYVPLCYDAAGTKTYAKVIMDAAALRIGGMGPMALKAEIEKRYRNRSYGAPTRAGLAYMDSPVLRSPGATDTTVLTFSAPHLMFYAPNLANEDIGVPPDAGHHASRLHPFVDVQGNAEQTYLIQAIGQTEKAQILANEQMLIHSLCAYRSVLCLPGK